MDTLSLSVYIPFLFALYIITKHFLQKIRNFPPTPILNLPFLGHLHLLNQPLTRSLAKISNRYGPILLLQIGSRRVLVVSSPSIAEECLSKNDIIFAKRPHLLVGKHLGYNSTSLAWTSYGDHWRNLRKISSTELLSTHRLQMLQELRTDEIKSMIHRMFRVSNERKPVDMNNIFLDTLMNMMARMIGGKRYYGDDIKETEEAVWFREIMFDTFRFGATSNMGDFFPVFKWLGVGGVEKRLIELQKKRDSFMQELVEECKKRISSDGEKVGNRQTMIQMLLTLQETQPKYYTDTFIKSLMLILLAAGTFTTFGTMEWVLSLLLNNPHVLKNAQLEIDNHIGYNRLINESDIIELPYLRSIINEAMRMYPPGPLLVPHESSKQCTVGGYHVPANTMLLVNLWAIQNDPKHWKDPEKFDPMRFEGLEGNRDGFKLMPFGSGRRSCPGEGLAMRMMGLGIGSIIQCFEWERIGKDLVDMTEGPGVALVKAQPLIAYCKPRPRVAKLISLNFKITN